MKRKVLLRVSVCVIVALILLVAASEKIKISYDLSSFLPPAQSFNQQILVKGLSESSTSDVVIVVLHDASELQAITVADKLDDINGISSAIATDPEIGSLEIPPLLWRNRLLLDDLPISKAEWTQIFEEKVSEAVFLGDEFVTSLLIEDPTMSSVRSLLNFALGQPHYESDGQRFVLVNLDIPVFDLGLKAKAVESMRDSLSNMDLGRIELMGSSIYALDLQATVQWEAATFSTIALILLVAFLTLKFRSPIVVIAIAAPILVGAAASMLAVSIAYTQVHGVILAGGFTMIGVAIDYPIHLFCRSNPHTSLIWPTLRLSIISTVLGYATFLISGTSGLEQMGLFAIVGIVTSAVAVYFVTYRNEEETATMKQDLAVSYWSDPPSRLNHVPWIVVVLVALVFLYDRVVFNDDLSRLTPIAAEVLARDGEVRKLLDLPSVRYVIAVESNELEEVLQQTESLCQQIRGSESNFKNSLQCITDLLPSHSTQESRRNLASSLVSHRTVEDGLNESLVKPQVFASFLNHLRHEAQRSDWLTFDDFEQSELSDLLQLFLYQEPLTGSWRSLIYFRGDLDPDKWEATVSSNENASFVDLKITSDMLVADFRKSFLTIAGVAVFFVIVAILIGTRSLNRVAWLVGTLGATVLVTTLLGALIHEGLSILDLMAMVLVVSLGLDYGLFHSKSFESASDYRDTSIAVMVCAASSGLVFAILAFSDIPILHSMGSTVAAGVACAYLITRFSVFRERDSESST